MKLLEDAVIRDKYDVVVVGAGIGGLTSAALLAKRGLRVLVIEQHYIPGGCCTAIRRQDIAMDVGAALLFGWADESNPHPFVMNEIEEEIDMIHHEALYRINLGSQTLTFWRDIDRFLDELTAVFPQQDKELRALYAECREYYDTMTGMSSFPTPMTEIPVSEMVKTFLKNPIATLKIQKLMSMSGSEVLNKHITDPKVASFFDFLVASCTTCNVKETPALMTVAIFVDNHLGGACYPSGSPQMLPNKLEKAIEKFGGQVLYRQSVSEILIFKDVAYGVRLDDGTEILADRVLSNATVWDLYGTLVKPKHIDPKRMEWAQNFEPTPGILMLYLGVKAEAVPEGTRACELLVDNIHDVNDANYMIFVPSLDDPSITPPGTHSMTVMGPTTADWPRPHDRRYQSEEYLKMKEEETEKMIAKLERRLFPNLRENIIVMEMGTPSTLERYLRKIHGNIGGPKLTLDQSFFNRLKARSDWKNLYCAGDSTTMGEGVISATMSGVGAANRILEDSGLPIYRPRTFPKKYVNMIEGKPWTETPDPSEPITEESAKRIGRDCQHCQTPGCKEACPAGIDGAQFARRIESGNLIGAARVLRETNPLSEICGYVCPAEKLCEKNCNRTDFDNKPVRIKELHGWVCGHVSRFEGWNRQVAASKGIKVAVVGAGPAGLSCAHYLARLGYQVDILDKAKAPGGMLAHAVPASRLPEEVVNREIEGLTMPGMNFQYGQALGKDFAVADLLQDHQAVFLAPGLWSGRGVKIPGLDKSKVTDALSYLIQSRTKKKAKTAKKVLVIGGGSVAADAALAAKDSGATDVTVVCLEGAQEMPCLVSEQEEMKSKGIRIENSWGPMEVSSDGELCFVHCLSVFDESGRFHPVFHESKTMKIAFDQVILAVGQTAEPALATYLKKEFGKTEPLEVDSKTMQVKDRPGIFAGGDIVNGAGTVVGAVADGRRAAMAIDEQVGGRPDF